MMTIDRQAKFINLLLAYRNGDLHTYLKLLDALQPYLDQWLFDLLYNLSRSDLFNRKGYFKK